MPPAPVAQLLPDVQYFALFWSTAKTERPPIVFFFEFLPTWIKFILFVCIPVACASSMRAVPACVVGLRGLLEGDLYWQT